MPCYAMPCHAMPRHAMPRHATPCHATPRHAMPCHAMPCHAMPCHAMLRYAMIYAMICYVILCYTILHYAILLLIHQLTILTGSCLLARPRDSRKRLRGLNFLILRLPLELHGPCLFDVAYALGPVPVLSLYFKNT